jgi:hypothetical protein
MYQQKLTCTMKFSSHACLVTKCVRISSPGSYTTSIVDCTAVLSSQECEMKGIMPLDREVSEGNSPIYTSDIWIERFQRAIAPSTHQTFG